MLCQKRRIIFIRHGEPGDTTTLSPKGEAFIRKQAGIIKSALKNIVPIIITSPSLRTYRTANIISDAFDSLSFVEAACLSENAAGAVEAGDLSLLSLLYKKEHEAGEPILTVIASSHDNLIGSYAEALTGEYEMTGLGGILIFEFDGKSWQEPGNAILKRGFYTLNLSNEFREVVCNPDAFPYLERYFDSGQPEPIIRDINERTYAGDPKGYVPPERIVELMATKDDDTLLKEAKAIQKETPYPNPVEHAFSTEHVISLLSNDEIFKDMLLQEAQTQCKRRAAKAMLDALISPGL